MVIPPQQITIQGWNTSTHDIVLGNLQSMTEYDKYLKAASPTTKQVTAARNEAWYKAHRTTKNANR